MKMLYEKDSKVDLIKSTGDLKLITYQLVELNGLFNFISFQIRFFYIISFKKSQ